MEAMDQSMKRIAGKLQLVMQRYQGLKKEHEQLIKETGILRQRGSQQQKKIEELETTIAALKTATGQLDDGEKKEVERRLGHYIREIDRCIALLSE
jgi:chromosome segregation ATPase